MIAVTKPPAGAIISHARRMPEQKALLWAECAIEPTKGAINNINVLINFMTGLLILQINGMTG